MTINQIIPLFGAMVVLAAIPSVSVLTVSTRSASFGFRHGVFTTLGIVVGDMIFILIAIWGLSLLVATMGSFFFILKYVAAAYLILLGITLCRQASQDIKLQLIVQSSLSSSFMTGLLITLADQKATLFYLGFFPAFLEVSTVSYLDTVIILLVTIVAVGGVKLIYAWLGERVRLLMNARLRRGLNIVAGCILVAVGISLITKA